MGTSTAPRQMAIIIPTWNGREMLRSCLASLRQQTFSDFQIYVVDNGSSDGTSAFVRDEYPDARVLLLETNFVGKGLFPMAPYDIVPSNTAQPVIQAAMSRQVAEED